MMSTTTTSSKRRVTRSITSPAVSSIGSISTSDNKKPRRASSRKKIVASPASLSLSPLPKKKSRSSTRTTPLTGIKSGKESPKKAVCSPIPKKKVSSSTIVTTTSSRKRGVTHLSRASPPPVLSSSYLENHNSKNDLVRRLREIVSQLSEEDVEANSPSYAGLEGLASSLVTDSYLEHKDKDVRLWTVLGCMEIFYLYAPEPPWDESEVLRVFSQMTRQLGNLAHCTSPSQANYAHYFRLLEQLSVVKVGCVLVEIAKGDNEEALEMLCSLVHSLLNSIHNDHPSDVASHVVSAISSCMEEYDETIPIPLLDQLLRFIADGPVTLVTNPAAVEAAARHYSATKAGKAPSPYAPPDQISQSNHAYVAAANVLRRTENQLSSPVANLLNSLLNSDAMVCAQSQLTREQVFAIIYEMHRIAPNVLTTVIGNVTNTLLSSDSATRHLAVKLLGKLFQAPTSNIGTQFAACFRDWTGRIYDASPDIRMGVVKYLVLILQNHKPAAMRRVATTSLKYILSSDPDADVRIQGIHDLCDLAYEDDGTNGVCLVVPSLLKAVGDRVRSKNKMERKDALTGLARIYYHRFIKEMTRDVSLTDVPDLEEDYFYADVTELEHTEEEEEDLNLRIPNHLHQKYSWIPSIIVESACFTDYVDSDMRCRLLQIMDDVLLNPSLSKDKNAIGFALFVSSLSENALKWLDTLLSSRYSLQKALDSYLSIRADLKQCDKVNKIPLEAKAMQHLHTMTSLTASSLTDDALQQVLGGIHSFKDQHAFRLLATIASPIHSFQARQRALEDLPKRLSSLGSTTTAYAKTLARRTAMGTMNMTTFETCMDLAKSCLDGANINATNIFLNCVEVLGRSFPPLIEAYVSPLIELYERCTIESKSNEEVQEVQDSLIDIFTIGAKANSLSLDHVKRASLKAFFQRELLLICTDGGEPDQCRSAILILASAFGSNLKSISSLVQTLTEHNFDIHNPRIDCILLSLSALIDCKPDILTTDIMFHKFQFIVDFAMDIISLKMDNGSVTESGKKKGKKNYSSGKRQDVFSGEHKRKCICAASDFLVSYVRSVVMSSKVKKSDAKSKKKAADSPKLSKEFISGLFCRISSFLLTSDDVSEEGMEDVKLHAALGLMRLSDSSLGLAEENLSTNMWHSLADIVLDPLEDVREGTLTEWNDMMLGIDKYCIQDVASAPALRFLAYCTLVPDYGDHSSKKGEPHHIGKFSHTLKSTTLQSIASLRRTCEQTLAQCRAISREAEHNFEKRYKMNIMPEFVVPFAFYLLVFREETPTSDDIGSDDDDKRQTLTRKRLKFLLEPLVTSLGDSADNISFLLRMVEILGKCQAVPPRTLHEDEVSCTQESGPMEIKKLELLSKTARELLLKFVKKDVNLTPYPSPIFIPSALFKKKSSRTSMNGSVNAGDSIDISTSQLSTKSPRRVEPAIRSSARKSIQSTGEKSHVTFNQEVEVSSKASNVEFDANSPQISYNRRSLTSSSIQDPPDWGDLSPIASDPSPARPRRLLTSASKISSVLRQRNGLSPIEDLSHTPESSEATSAKASVRSSTKKRMTNKAVKERSNVNSSNSKRKVPATPESPASSKASNSVMSQNSQKSSYKEDTSLSQESEKSSIISDKRRGRSALKSKGRPLSEETENTPTQLGKRRGRSKDTPLSEETEKSSSQLGKRRGRSKDTPLSEVTEKSPALSKRNGRPPLKPKDSDISLTPSSQKPKKRMKLADKSSSAVSKTKNNIRDKRVTGTPSSELDSEPSVKTRAMRRSPRSTMDDSSSKLSNVTKSSSKTKSAVSDESSIKNTPVGKTLKKNQNKSIAANNSTSSKSTVSNGGKKLLKRSVSNKNKTKSAQSTVSSISSKDTSAQSKTKIDIVTRKHQPVKQTKRKKRVNDEFEFNDVDLMGTKKAKTKS